MLLNIWGHQPLFSNYRLQLEIQKQKVF